MSGGHDVRLPIDRIEVVVQAAAVCDPALLTHSSRRLGRQPVCQRLGLLHCEDPMASWMGAEEVAERRLGPVC